MAAMWSIMKQKSIVPGFTRWKAMLVLLSTYKGHVIEDSTSIGNRQKSA